MPARMALKDRTVFKTVAFVRSAILPARSVSGRRLRGGTEHRWRRIKPPHTSSPKRRPRQQVALRGDRVRVFAFCSGVNCR